MTTESSIQEAAGGAFITALLLSGEPERAEAAVLQAIGSMTSDGASGDELIRETVNAAVELDELPTQFPGSLGPAAAMLPFELRRVLALPHYLRQCFVLRVLVSLPREVCARLLHSNVSQIDEGVRAAMMQLPETQGSISAFQA